MCFSVCIKSSKLRGAVDDYLNDILKNGTSVESFHKCFSHIFKDLSICIESSTKSVLSVCGPDEAYSDVTYIWFYIQKLKSLNYIDFVSAAVVNSPNKEPNSEKFCLGESSEINKGYLSAEVSRFFEDNVGANIIVSPEFKEYVKAGHVTPELMYARRCTWASFLAVIIAVFSTIITAINSL